MNGSKRMATCHPDREHHGKGLCRSCYGAARHAIHYAAHRDEERARLAAYYIAHREERRIRSTAYRAAHREEVLAHKVASRQALKLEAFKIYGGPKCTCCGETLIQGLTIDHVDGGGAAHREQQGISNIYSWLKMHNYPPGFQVLCYTCNCAKDTGDHCPHREQRASLAEAVLVRPEDTKALEVASIDGLPVEPDGCVTPGCIFFVVAG